MCSRSTSAAIAQYGGSAIRNGEPFGELAIVRQQDAAWADPNGGPRDPQGPLAHASRDVRVSARVQPLYEESATAAGSGATQPLSESDLTSIVVTATQFWIDALGTDDARLATLRHVDVHVAAGRMDLFTVVAHELGNAMRFAEDDHATSRVTSRSARA